MPCPIPALIAAASALEDVALCGLDNPCCCGIVPALMVLLLLGGLMSLIAKQDKAIWRILYWLVWSPLLPFYGLFVVVRWLLAADTHAPSSPPPPSREARAAEARRRYEATIYALENAGLDPIELAAGRTKAKQQLLRDLDGAL